MFILVVSVYKRLNFRGKNNLKLIHKQSKNKIVKNLLDSLINQVFYIMCFSQDIISN